MIVVKFSRKKLIQHFNNLHGLPYVAAIRVLIAKLHILKSSQKMQIHLFRNKPIRKNESFFKIPQMQKNKKNVSSAGQGFLSILCSVISPMPRTEPGIQ